MEKEELVNAIVQLEWEAFDKVDNLGGRAGCQNDGETFSIMRKSQLFHFIQILCRQTKRSGI